MPKALIMGGLYQPLVTSDLPDPHIWYSNDFPWPQDVKFDLGLGWPQAALSDLGISNSLHSLEKALIKTGMKKYSAT